MSHDLLELPIWLLTILFIALLTQGTYLFVNARRNGRMYWFWGIWGMLSLPMPLIVYLLYTNIWIPYRQRRKNYE
ncbi:transcriptional regulator [Geomicrobium sp. JSM 1781026]|uniref:transcriptional regulator n=1 Tax=Geomicrobium sp. JSM 1781026 TaxID=3344580 RepID=UPI0035BF61F1